MCATNQVRFVTAVLIGLYSADMTASCVVDVSATKLTMPNQSLELHHLDLEPGFSGYLAIDLHARFFTLEKGGASLTPNARQVYLDVNEHQTLVENITLANVKSNTTGETFTPYRSHTEWYYESIMMRQHYRPWSQQHWGVTVIPRYPAGLLVFGAAKNVRLSDASLCNQDLQNATLTVSGDAIIRFDPGNNTNSDGGVTRYFKYVVTISPRDEFTMTTPPQLVLPAKQTGSTTSLSFPITFASTKAGTVEYRFSYTSTSKTRETVTIDQRDLSHTHRLPVAQGLARATTASHTVSVTSPDAGKITGNLVVEAKVL